MTAAGAIYHAAGSPSQPGTERGLCRLCGDDATGTAWGEWIKETFTNHDKLTPGTIICHACLFCTDDHNLTLQQRTGRDKPQRMRNYSHIVTRGRAWHPLMKNQKRLIARHLQAWPAHVAVISLAGQKHLIFRARVGTWQIEEQSLAPQPTLLAHLITHAASLYTAGASKTAIEVGEYDQRTLMAIGLTTWQRRERELRAHRGSLLFQLAVWLARKDEADDRDPRQGDDAAPADLGGRAAGLQGEIQVHDLAAVRGPGSERGVHDDAQPVSQPDLFAAGRDPAR